MRQRGLEPRQPAPEPALSVHDRRRQDGRFECPGRITELVLPELRNLDPGQRREGPAGRHEVGPGRLRIPAPTDTSEQPRPLTEQAALRPRRVPPNGIGRRPRVREGVAARPAAEIRTVACRPPRNGVFRIRPVRRRPGDLADP